LLRIKDIEFAEKSLENYKKQTRRGGQSLEMKNLLMEQATVEKVIEHLKAGKDVRKNHWSPKEVCLQPFLLPCTTRMNQRFTSLIPALRIGTSIFNAEVP
jgi:ribosome-binding ATPase YchF (GTP1/OBG family)